MSSVLKLPASMRTLPRPKYGPADDGKPITEELASIAQWEPGYRYEIIHGRISVSPQPRFSHEFLSDWLSDKLKAYAKDHPEVFNFISLRARIFVPGTTELTVPEPDISAFKIKIPGPGELTETDWEDQKPILVVEIISPKNADKDEIRNVALYLQVPSIREYWILDPTEDADRPSLRVYRRRGKKWQTPIHLSGGETYESSRFLPGFRLVLDRLR